MQPLNHESNVLATLILKITGIRKIVSKVSKYKLTHDI